LCAQLGDGRDPDDERRGRASAAETAFNTMTKPTPLQEAAFKLLDAEPTCVQ
jgi:hypothetical protein